MSLIVSPVSRHRLETWSAWGEEGQPRSRSWIMTVSYTYKIYVASSVTPLCFFLFSQNVLC